MTEPCALPTFVIMTYGGL